MKTGRVPLHVFVLDPEQPRKLFDSGKIAGLTDNMKAIGQQVPVIAWQGDGKVYLCDGECRWRAAKVAGIPDLLTIVLPERPSKAQLRIIQASLDVHRVSLNPMERSNLFAEIQQESNWSVSELAKQLSVHQTVATKFLAFQKGSPEVQSALRANALDTEKAYLICQIDDHAQQVAMLKEAAHMSRDNLRAKVKGNGKAQPKSKRAVFPLPGGMVVSVNGREADLPEIVEGLGSLLKELRKGISQGLTVDSAQRVMKDRCSHA